jgi:predicted CoA-binding protein
MKAVVQKVNLSLAYCDAKTANDILVVFRPPLEARPHVGDILEVDLMALAQEQTIRNETQDQQYKTVIKSIDLHDLRLPASHGSSRFPSIERRLDVASK